jgi:hypothetical protein
MSQPQVTPVVAKEPWGDMLKRIFFNATNPITDDGGGKVVGLAIKAGQEVVYSKVIRKFMRADNKSWMNLTIFSLLTAAFDDGLGAWYGEKKAAAQQGFGDVAKEFPRPLLSCIAINYIMNSVGQGFHNPMKSFGFRELLIQLAAKDIAEGGNAVLVQQFKTAKDKIEAFQELQGRQRAASRLLKKPDPAGTA